MSSPLLLGSSDTAFSVLSSPSFLGSCKHAHTPQGHTHMAPAPGSHTLKTIWALHCRLNLRREQAPLLLTGRLWQVHTGTVAHTHMQSNAVGSTHPDHCGHSHRWRHWDMRRHKHACTHMHTSRPSRLSTRAQGHPNPPTLRHPRRCPARPQHQAPPPPLFRSRWRGLGFEGALPPPSLWPRLSKVQSPGGIWSPPRPPAWLEERLARGGMGSLVSNLSDFKSLN